MNKTIKGYKAFDKDLRCRGFQYEIGERYEQEELPIVCDRGFHFCKQACDVFRFYDFDPDKTRVCEVEAYGEVTEGENKCATNKIKIVREISWEEFLTLCNTGKGNSGLRNSGDGNSGNYNSGYGNSGNYNSGYGNSGNRNSGNRNSGSYNSGYGNSGNRNSGNRNSGSYNSGNYNSGYGNSGNYNSGYGNSGDGNSGNRNSGSYNSGYGNSGTNNNGVFCTGEPKIMLFNKPSNMTLSEFYRSNAYYALNKYFENNVWVCEEDMTDEEKTNNPEYKTLGGYLKTIPQKEAWINVWAKMTEEEKELVKSLPNFDAEIFKECTGIEV